MTEIEYIATTNLAKVRMIEKLVRTLSFSSEQPAPGFVSENEYANVLVQLYRWDHELKSVAKVEP